MLILREVDENDLMLLFEWVNDETVRRQSFNSKPITIEEHTVWFQNRLTDSNCLFFIMENDCDKIGMIRLERIDNRWRISYLIAPEFRGQGFGSIILELAEHIFERESSDICLYGLVKRDNVASIKAFIKNNYTLKMIGNDIEFVKNIKTI